MHYKTSISPDYCKRPFTRKHIHTYMNANTCRSLYHTIIFHVTPHFSWLPHSLKEPSSTAYIYHIDENAVGTPTCLQNTEDNTYLKITPFKQVSLLSVWKSPQRFIYTGTQLALSTLLNTFFCYITSSKRLTRFYMLLYIHVCNSIG